MTTKSTKPSAVAHLICAATELPPGSRRIVEIAGRSIGVFNVDGQIRALKNICPHKLAPLCEGTVTGLVSGDLPGSLTMDRCGEVIRCPWHGWEFDIHTGQSVFNPHRVRIKTYPAGLAERDAATNTCTAESDESIETFPAQIEDCNVVVYL